LVARLQASRLAVERWQEGNFAGWMSEAEAAEMLRQAAEAALAMAEEAAADLTVDEDW
jgi:hypothetical protein